MVRKSQLTIEMVKNKINELVGKDISMRVCRGRKQVKQYKGVIESTFPSVFVVRLTGGGHTMSSLSYSYSDIVCGEVVISEAT